MECTKANIENNYMKPTIRVMKSGDLIILYERHDSMSYIYLDEGKAYNNKFGNFLHNDFIGNPYGSKIHSRSTKGWIYALEASPALWSAALRVSETNLICLYIYIGLIIFICRIK
jgi:tRNA A58 N-methylase Trm61